MASDKVGVKCALRTAALGHFVTSFHRLPDDCGLDKYSKTVLDSVNRLGIGKDWRDLIEPHVEHPRGSNRVQNCPLLSGEGEYRKLLSVRSDVAAERVFATNVRSVFDAVNAGTRHEEGSNRDTPNRVPQAARASLGASRESPRRAVGGNLTWLKCVIKKSRGEAPLRRDRRMEMMPGNDSRVLQIGTRKGRIPLSSPLMMRRAITTATLSTPNVGLEAGMILNGETDERHIDYGSGIQLT